MVSALIASILVTFPAENQKLPATDRAYVIGAADTNRKERLYRETECSPESICQTAPISNTGQTHKKPTAHV